MLWGSEQTHTGINISTSTFDIRHRYHHPWIIFIYIYVLYVYTTWHQKIKFTRTRWSVGSMSYMCVFVCARMCVFIFQICLLIKWLDVECGLDFLPVLILAGRCRPENGRIRFSGELQSFSSLSEWIFSDTWVITEVLWMNFPNHKCMTWPFLAHNMSFSCIQLHGLFKPNNLKAENKNTLMIKHNLAFWRRRA